MNVIVCRRPGELILESRERPVRGPGQVLIRIRRVGMCGTDYHIFQGTHPYLDYPRVPGHELAGEIVESDSEGRFAAGQTVCVMPYLSCSECEACRGGKTNCCTNIEVLGVHRDGGLAEYLTIDSRFVVDARGLPLDHAAMVEFLSIGHHAVDRAAVRSGQRVLVVGAGPIGMATILFAARRGADVTVADMRADRAQLCVSELGARSAAVADATLPQQLSDISAGLWFDVVFDATGNAEAMERGFAFVAHGGTYALISVVPSAISFSDPEFHKREMSLLASRNSTMADFEAVITAIGEGRIPLSMLLTHSAVLSELPRAIPEWMKPDSGVIKAFVTL